MANQRITSLTALLGIDVADDDVFPVVDISDTTHNPTGTTKKITKSELSGIFGSGSTEGLTESTTARTLVIGDAAKFIWCTHADGCDITIPPQSSVTWADDTEIHGLGTLGDVTFTEGSGVTVTPVNSQLKTATATTAWTLKRQASDSWWLVNYDGVSGGGGGSSPIQAWVNFNGSGTVAIRESSNVSSITDNGTGDYTINFTSDLTDTNYTALLSSQSINSADAGANLIAAGYSDATRLVGSFRLQTTSPGGSTPAFQDVSAVYAGFIR